MLAPAASAAATRAPYPHSTPRSARSGGSSSPDDGGPATAGAPVGRGQRARYSSHSGASMRPLAAPSTRWHTGGEVLAWRHSSPGHGVGGNNQAPSVCQDLLHFSGLNPRRIYGALYLVPISDRGGALPTRAGACDSHDRTPAVGFFIPVVLGRGHRAHACQLRPHHPTWPARSDGAAAGSPGLRAGDVVALQLTDIDGQAGTVQVASKNRRDNRLPF